MNIWAIRGHKVKVTSESAKNGNPYDHKKIQEYLEIEKEYEVFQTDIHSFVTDVYLEGVVSKSTEKRPIYFNSVNFVDVIPQSDEDNEKHRQNKRYC